MSQIKNIIYCEDCDEVANRTFNYGTFVCNLCDSCYNDGKSISKRIVESKTSTKITYDNLDYKVGYVPSKEKSKIILNISVKTNGDIEAILPHNLPLYERAPLVSQINNFSRRAKVFRRLQQRLEAKGIKSNVVITPKQYL